MPARAPTAATINLPQSRPSLLRRSSNTVELIHRHKIPLSGIHARLEMTVLRQQGPEFFVGLVDMQLLAAIAWVLGLAILLIVGFLDVTHNLLSRSIFAPPSCPNEEHFEQVDRCCSYLKPERMTAGATQDAPAHDVKCRRDVDSSRVSCHRRTGLSRRTRCRNPWLRRT
jgi:hypothetical protein